MKYFKFQVRAAHVGTGRKNEITCTLYAYGESMLEAYDFVRRIPGIKHSRLPVKATRITEDEYIRGRNANGRKRDTDTHWKKRQSFGERKAE